MSKRIESASRYRRLAKGIRSSSAGASSNSSSPACAVVRGDEVCTAAQNIAEFWNVSTRPRIARGGYGFGIPLVDARVRYIERIATILPFTLRAYEEWRRLLITHQVMGVAVHDARIVATMICEGVDQLVTLNVQDFRRYPGVVAIPPEQVLVP